MAKAMSVEEAQGNEPEADAESAASGRFARLLTAARGLPARFRTAVSAQIGVAFDAVIAGLQRQRAKFAPPASPEAAQALATALAVEKPPGRGIMRKLMISLLLVMAGAVAGSIFAFTVFAQKIERQSDLISNQADEVFEYRNDAERADAARDKARDELNKVRDELKAVRRELTELDQTYQETKTRLAEAEGRMLMYGGARAAAERPAPRAPVRSGGSAQAGTRANERSGECALNSGSAGSDLSRCLSMTR